MVHSHLRFITRLRFFSMDESQFQQECIQVGYVPSAAVALSGGGGVSAKGGVCQADVCPGGLLEGCTSLLTSIITVVTVGTCDNYALRCSAFIYNRSHLDIIVLHIVYIFSEVGISLWKVIFFVSKTYSGPMIMLQIN